MSTTTISPGPAALLSGRVASATAPRAVRLTRRGRLVMLLGWLLVALVVGFVLAAGSAADADAGAPEPERVVVVAPGETLWDLAAGVAADSGEDDVRTTMTRIMELNGLESAVLGAGQQLRVPLG